MIMVRHIKIKINMNINVDKCKSCVKSNTIEKHPYRISATLFYLSLQDQAASIYIDLFSNSSRHRRVWKRPLQSTGDQTQAVQVTLNLTSYSSEINNLAFWVIIWMKMKKPLFEI